jgi:hypothetical protein
MRGRLIVIAIALAVLAVAGIRHHDQARAVQPQSDAGFGQFEHQPAPEPDWPAVVRAAVDASATFQTPPVVELTRRLRPALGVFTLGPRLPVVARGPDKPRVFPLLI